MNSNSNTSVHEVAPALRATLRGTMWVSAAVGVLMVVMLPFQVPTTSTGWKNFVEICGLCFGSAIVLFVMDRIWFAPYLEVCASSLKQVFPSGKVVEIRWGDIIEIRESAAMQRLVVRSSMETTINVEHQLVGFDQVRQTLRTSASHAHWH